MKIDHMPEGNGAFLSPAAAAQPRTAARVEGMRRERPSVMVDLGREPPIDPEGQSSPHSDRRSFSLRWLTASILTGVSGAALLGAAIYIALQGDTIFAQLPERAREIARRADDGAASGNRIVKGDKLVRTELFVAAKQTIKAPMTMRVGDREVIKVRPFLRLATNLSQTAGVYATDIPPFNPLKLYAEGEDTSERFGEVEPAPADADADVSFVRRDLDDVEIEADAPGLTDEEALAQLAEEQRLTVSVRNEPSLTAPAQLMLSRTLRHVALASPALAYANPIDAPFKELDIRVVPENVTIVARQVAGENPAAPEEKVVAVKKGAKLADILKAEGASDREIAAILAALGSDTVKAVREGQNVRLLLAPNIDGSGPRRISRVMIVDSQSIAGIAALDDKGRFVPVSLPQEEFATASAETGEDVGEDGENGSGGRGARLYESLYETALKNGISREVVQDLIRIFAYDVDFQRRVGPNDSIELFMADDDGTAAGDVLFAALTVGGERRAVYRYQSPEDNTVDYFDEDGRSLKKFLLRKPITDGVMRSGFGTRRHPILGYSKMHTGVDWANRSGTPILAAGDGVVIKAGWSSGYGRRIEIQHANGYVTTYSHQSAFARGIQEGVRVRQGQVIGYVGNTGLSTGAHLHYEVLVNGHFVNPMKIKVPRGRELEGTALAEFRRQRDQIRELRAKAETGMQVAEGG
ncbi:M23 family metallopeptidase [Chelatococcus composti]|jgi:Membrane proteins related to metalloendopeptidases|uniref:Murein DD-endopeptidase MepM/ murein hydrolase activator NlpD n=1 Tax=Chelatococcus composti TaxID=1743235 RepID=A0A841KA51_9HYPH|nr:M23 family metallopeptidase [Chelatococcus composti]MBB6169748.1 murein DD-endopeptidase MepM/ murein hydrolase activator NlpD [Chelatococcus composti]GGG50062.1 membrane protein [Chelatococcus composti]